jgi:hypothetical protein
MCFEKCFNKIPTDAWWQPYGGFELVKAKKCIIIACTYIGMYFSEMKISHCLSNAFEQMGAFLQGCQAFWNSSGQGYQMVCLHTKNPN